MSTYFLFLVCSHDMNKNYTINDRLRYLIISLPGWSNRGSVGKDLNIEKSRWSRIIRHNEKLYDHEIIAIKKHFNSYYDWILEGLVRDGYEKNLSVLFEYMSLTLSDKEKLELLTQLKNQNKD